MTRYPNARYPEACDLLEAAGIDPATVSENGVDSEGYFEVQFHEGAPVHVRKAWPNPRLATEVLAAMANPFKSLKENQ